jgi:hypothetical protein
LSFYRVRGEGMLDRADDSAGASGQTGRNEEYAP